MSKYAQQRRTTLLTGYRSYRNLIYPIVLKFNLSDEIKRDFFQAVVVATLLYGCTTWTLTKCTEKKLDGKYSIIILCAVLNKPWKQHPMKSQLYGHLSLISQTIQVRRTRDGEAMDGGREARKSMLSVWLEKKQGQIHKPRSLMYLWTCQCWHTSKNLHQLCKETRCSLEDLSEAMDDRDGW